MEFTENSDNEFWAEIEGTADKESCVSHNIEIKKLGSNIDILVKNKIDTSPTKIQEKFAALPNKDYYEDKIDRIRESKDQEFKTFSIVTKNHFKREFLTMFNDIKDKYKQHMLIAQQECVNLKEIIYKRDSFINKLCRIICDIEVDMLSAKFNASVAIYNKKKMNKVINEEFYLQQMNDLSLKLTTTKEICVMYQKEIDNLKLKAKNAQENFVKTENSLKNEIKSLQEAIKKLKIDHEVQVKSYLQEFEKFKKDINIEQTAKDVIVDRQQIHIHGLRDELKNAKIVLQNRKLRTKLYEKLDDYMKDNEKSKIHKKNSSAANSRPISSNFRTSDPNNFTRTRKSEAYSPNGPIFSRKISSPSYFNVD